MVHVKVVKIEDHHPFADQESVPNNAASYFLHNSSLFFIILMEDLKHVLASRLWSTLEVHLIELIFHQTGPVSMAPSFQKTSKERDQTIWDSMRFHWRCWTPMKNCMWPGYLEDNCPSLNHLMNWSYVERSREDVIGFAHRFQSFALAFFRQPPWGGQNVHPGWTLHGVSSQWGERHWLMYSMYSL